MLNQSQQNFTRVTTVTLLWRVQILLWSVEYVMNKSIWKFYRISIFDNHIWHFEQLEVSMLWLAYLKCALFIFINLQLLLQELLQGLDAFVKLLLHLWRHLYTYKMASRDDGRYDITEAQALKLGYFRFWLTFKRQHFQLHCLEG